MHNNKETYTDKPHTIFPWNDSFKLGILLVDQQHERLAGLVNILANHLIYNADVPALSAVFNELADYAVYHFHTEETIWHQSVPDDSWETRHKDVHDSFIEEVSRLRAGYGGKPLDEAVPDILSFLTNWLAFHILDSDKRMAKLVRATQSGLPLEEAKRLTSHEMSGAIKALIEALLSMYQTLSCRTLQLLTEIVERQKAEVKLRLASSVFDNTLEAICITDADGIIIDANPAFSHITQYAHDKVLGNSLDTLMLGAESDAFDIANVWQAAREEGHWNGEIRSRCRSGGVKAGWLTLSAVKDERGNICNFVAVFSCVEQLIKRQHEMEFMVNHDALTQLPNRLLMTDRLELAIAHAERSHEYLAVCFLDLDGFKAVNDVFGHAAGDCLLQEIARRFSRASRRNDTVARVGGDEFVILLNGLRRSVDCCLYMDKLLDEIEQPVLIKNDIIRVSASIGIALFPDDGNSAEALLRHADQAMYRSKKSGKAGYCFYNALQNYGGAF
ncbi:diguanylate cyclase [Candidatus Methylospira mobilis]|uniref:Diguanylate cyclase n=1 Tax=Candidatus Methylospira mobilis TaxID=1808979 RepID=A0A5Q0BHW8_9GAMM|nr:diguanylate cyclase [Candidatus Methylospira mobilis]QFY43420.1 diguanylate cyclase [Candidatus Methylospira mobilis]WNV03341.1 diguanylate cyclase [Candidatus Methylospira mobilis]